VSIRGLHSRPPFRHPNGTLPNGFLAIDLASALFTDLLDPDQHVDGGRLYKNLHIEPNINTWEHPALGNGLIGQVLRPDGSDALAIVAANGGSDHVYVPSRRPELVERIVNLLLAFDYGRANRRASSAASSRPSGSG
jgi:hypothetical protein